MHRSVIEVARVFLKLGAFGFGGPAALVAMMEGEVVGRRRWLDRQQFLDLLGATNLIPGPNSTEMAIHLGYVRAGWVGLAVGGLCFILPATVITAILAWAYVTVGPRDGAASWWAGIGPAILAIMALAVWRLGRTAVKSVHHLGIGAAVAIAPWLRVDEVVALFAGGLLGMLWLQLVPSRVKRGAERAVPMLVVSAMAVWAVGLRAASLAGASASPHAPLADLGLFFLKVGSVLYGSGYVLVAFLEQGVVRDHAWLSRRQLLDAVAIGQFTPGPVSSTVTFIGYLLGGLPGALVATGAMFLPSFGFVAGLQRVVPLLRRSVWSAAFIDAVNVSAIGLMLMVTVKLSWTELTGWRQWGIALITLALGLVWDGHPAALIAGGAVAGLLLF